MLASLLPLQVRVEAALTLRALAEVDPACANNLLSCGVTSLRALRETLVVEKVQQHSSFLSFMSSSNCMTTIELKNNYIM